MTKVMRKGTVISEDISCKNHFAKEHAVDLITDYLLWKIGFWEEFGDQARYQYPNFNIEDDPILSRTKEVVDSLFFGGNNHTLPQPFAYYGRIRQFFSDLNILSQKSPHFSAWDEWRNIFLEKKIKKAWRARLRHAQTPYLGSVSFARRRRAGWK